MRLKRIVCLSRRYVSLVELDRRARERRIGIPALAVEAFARAEGRHDQVGFLVADDAVNVIDRGNNLRTYSKSDPPLAGVAFVVH